MSEQKGGEPHTHEDGTAPVDASVDQEHEQHGNADDGTEHVHEDGTRPMAMTRERSRSGPGSSPDSSAPGDRANVIGDRTAEWA